MSNGGPAFPTCDHADGMSLRDYFAGQALLGLCGNPDYVKTVKEFTKNDARAGQAMAARSAYRIADAMLTARGEELL